MVLGQRPRYAVILVHTLVISTLDADGGQVCGAVALLPGI